MIAQSKLKLLRKRAKEQQQQDQETIRRLEGLLMQTTQANTVLRDKASTRIAALKKQIEEKDLEMSRSNDDRPAAMLSSSVPTTPFSLPPTHAYHSDNTPSAARALPFSFPAGADGRDNASSEQNTADVSSGGDGKKQARPAVKPRSKSISEQSSQ